MAVGSMLVKVWNRSDETGLLDDEFKDGDIAEVRDTSWVFGGQELKSWLVVRIDNVPNIDKFLPGAGPHYPDSPLTEPEYGIPESPGASQNPIRRQRKFRLDWRTKFNGAETDIIEDANQVLPDGQTSGGGSVLNGIVSDLFTFNDLIRK